MERLTLDLEVSLEMTARSLENFLKVMGEYNLIPRIPVAPEMLLDPAAVTRLVEERNAIVSLLSEI